MHNSRSMYHVVQNSREHRSARAHDRPALAVRWWPMRPMRTRTCIMHAQPMTQARVRWIHAHLCTCTCVHNYTHGICAENGRLSNGKQITLYLLNKAFLRKTAFLFYYPCNAEAVGIFLLHVYSRKIGD